MSKLDAYEDAYVLCEDGRLSAVGRMSDLGALDGDVEELDGRGRSVVPGLVDCHTHACFAGDRADEFSRRAAGATYEELHAAGGGILSTVGATRAAGEEGLAVALARHRAWMLAAGTTTFEAKSGYGLDRDTELAQLRVIREAGGIPTWLGAHAVPPEFPDADAYLDFALEEVLPEAARLAEAADVFLERGAFDAAHARRYLEACRDAGLSLRLHADQFTEGGGIQLAIELGARSVDHLEATGPEGVQALARSDVAAVLLPVAAVFLGRPMPPGHDLLEAGAILPTRSARPRTWAALTVQAASAATGPSPIWVHASVIATGNRSQYALPGLKSVASATIAPASSRSCPGGMGRPRKSAATGSRTAATSLRASA